ncbi:peroxisomal membrane protein 13-like [Impatiens glandulifera]|uniref:peroxisomal membrane protein 13-like n=1 Tax=Impatiens glandulifera TaxID=253017 RepID=UPI001FB112FA|nr:peroxisomal membrane protein 13-like [Impatiens glandulifera]
MASNSNPTGGGRPPKPWEQVGGSSGPTPFKPPSTGSTSSVVEASGTAQPGEIVPAVNRTGIVDTTTLARPVPTRPWEQQTYGGYGSTMNYNSGYGSSYGSGMYGSSYGGVYGGGLQGNMYRGVGGYGGGLYGGSGGGLYGGSGGGLYGGSGMYGGGMYNSGPMGGYGMGMGDPNGNQDPNNPYGGPPSPPGFWISFLRVMEGVVNFFGRVATLIDQNTQAFHMFTAALLQLCDRSGMLYGELARFVLRLLGVRTRPKKIHPGHHNPHGAGNHIEGPKAAPSGSWDNVWGDGSS